MNRPRNHLSLLLSAALLLTVPLTACDRPLVGEGEGEGEGELVLPPDAKRVLGESSFLSADGHAGQDTPEDDFGRDGDQTADPAAPPEAGAEDGDDREVTEGDIYRVLQQGDLIANLNAYRGLQLIDVSNPDAPEITGRLQITGSPVEMYIAGNKAFILMNNWYGYYGQREDLASFGQLNGGVIATVDISDVNNPVLTDQAFIPGNISKSRLVSGSTSAALYVAASRYDSWENDDGSWSWETRTTVKSFDVSGNAITDKTELDLGGYVTDIQATPQALLVARYDWSWNPSTEDYNGSQVSIIDISSPDGTMAFGDTIEVAGYVENQFNMDLDGDVLRIASGAQWGNSTTNHIQTYDASDLANLVQLDHATFGDGERLFATLFLGNKAFMVTYLQVDPFHAFEITDAGLITEKSEFVVSGWNEFFRAVNADERLIGIGINDEESRTLSVSLYDITNLENPEPLIARADVEAETSWSEAVWDHRAFSVIEGAVDVTNSEGGAETGLVLLPFSGWSDDYDTYTAAVQIFTFGPDSLTRRGSMVHGTPVRRSFQPEDDLTANLSEAELSLFGTLDPDQPEERGRVELAPDYADLLVFGGHAARVKPTAGYWSYWGGEDLPATLVEMVPRSDNPDTGDAVASFEVDAGAQLYKSGDQLVAVASRYVDNNNGEYSYESTVKVIDLSDPTVPVTAAEFTTDRIQPSYGYWGGYPIDDCFDCGGGMWWGGYGVSDDVKSIPNGLAFLQRHYEQELVGTENVCYSWPTNNNYDCQVSSDGENETCTYIEGSRTCRTLDGEDEALCNGSFRSCTYTWDGNDYSYECEDLTLDEVQVTTECYDYDRYRYWQRMTVEVLDLTDPTAPALADTVQLPEHDEGVRMVANDSTLWVSYKRPVNVPGSALPFVRYYVRPIDVSDPANPSFTQGINVPGELLAVAGNDLYTRDYLWGEDIVETSINKVQVAGNLAFLEAFHTFSEQLVRNVTLDGAGHALITHQKAWPFVETEEDYATHLSVLDADDDLAVLSDTVVDAWATLKDGTGGRALFQVPGGLLVLNLDDATAPYAQAFFPLRGWPSRIRVEGDDVLVPAGRFGIYTFDLDTFNLLPPL